jgi:hypothetical protein
VSRPEVIVRSTLSAPPDAVWERIASFEGVNDELGPWLRMTAPAGVRDIDPARVPLGRKWFRSWVLLFGVLPVDYDDLMIVRLEPGQGFQERSRTLSLRVWEHERTLRAAGPSGCLVTDRLSFEPRVPGMGGIARRVVGAIFRHRHRRLRRHFGGSPA